MGYHGKHFDIIITSYDLKGSITIEIENQPSVDSSTCNLAKNGITIGKKTDKTG